MRLSGTGSPWRGESNEQFRICSPEAGRFNRPINRVLHLGSGAVYGGVEAFLVSVASGSILTRPEFALSSAGRLLDELEATGRPVHLLPGSRLSRPRKVWKARRELSRILTANPCSLAVSHSGWTQILFGPVLRRHRIPLVVWIHSVDTDRPWIEGIARRHPPVRVLMASRYLDTLTRDWYPGIPRQTIPYPVKPSVPIPAEKREEIRREFGVVPGETVILISCRFEPWKGHEQLLQALGILRDQPGWKLWIAGGAQGPGEKERVTHLQELIPSLGLGGRIRFLGQRSDVPTLLQASDLHCQPNPSPEPFGIAYVEALYAGIPVVSTAIGGAQEIVDESCGVLVPPNEAEALAAALRALIQDPARRHTLGAAAPARARLLCDPARQIAEFEEALVCSMPLGAPAP